MSVQPLHPTHSQRLSTPPSFPSPFSTSPSSSPSVPNAHKQLRASDHARLPDPISPRTGVPPRFDALDFAKLVIPTAGSGANPGSTSDAGDARSPPSLLTSLLLQSRSSSRSGQASTSDQPLSAVEGQPLPPLFSNHASRQSSASSQSQPCTPPSALSPLAQMPAGKSGANKPILLRPRAPNSSASTSTTPYTSASEDNRPFGIGIGLGLSRLSEADSPASNLDSAHVVAPKLNKRKSCLKFAVQHVSPLSSPPMGIVSAVQSINEPRRHSIKLDQPLPVANASSPPRRAQRQRGMMGMGRSCYPSPPPASTIRVDVFPASAEDIEHIEQASDMDEDEGYEEDSESGFTSDSEAADFHDDESDLDYRTRHAASFDSHHVQSYESHFDDESVGYGVSAGEGGGLHEEDSLRAPRATGGSGSGSGAGGLAPPNAYAYRWPLPSPHRPPPADLPTARPSYRSSHNGETADSYFPPVPFSLTSSPPRPVPSASRRVSVPHNIPYPETGTRHFSPPPQAPLSSPIETAPPAACSPSAAEFVRRRSSKSGEGALGLGSGLGFGSGRPAEEEDLPPFLQVGDGRRPSRQWDAVDQMDGLGALARYTYAAQYGRKASEPTIVLPRRGILKRHLTTTDRLPQAFLPTITARGRSTASRAPAGSNGSSTAVTPRSGRSGATTPSLVPPRVMRRGTAPAALPKLGAGFVIDVEGEMGKWRDGEAKRGLEKVLKGR